MRPRLLFAHGWALDRTVWDAVLADLGAAADGAIVLDAGYYGRPADGAPRGDGPVLGVGQSLGVLELLTLPGAPLAGLVAIDGFARFATGPDFPQGQPAAAMALMARRLRASPGALVRTFLTQALNGAPDPTAATPLGAPDRERLARGLERLSSLDGRAAARRQPVWRVHARADPIAPLVLSDASFAGADVRARHIRETADHLSPLTAPRTCADMIRDALTALSA